MTRTTVARYAIDQVILALNPSANIPPRSIGYSKLTCPFHDDSVASASIDWDNERFKCFTCDTHGDAIALVQAVKEVEFGSALAFCKEAADSSSQSVQRPARRKRTSLF